MPFTKTFAALALAVAAVFTAPAAARTAPAVVIGSPHAYPAAPGDTWFSTWASGGQLYVTSDDSPGFGSRCRAGNLIVNELAGSSEAQLGSSFANCMTSYGAAQQQGAYHDGRTWKTVGILAVGSTLYLAVARQQDGSGGYPAGQQPSDDASIVRSTDGGHTWANSFGTTGSPGGGAPPAARGGGAQAMFSGTSFATPAFIQYGQGSSVTADGSGQYVYAISNNGFAYDGSWYILGRVLRSKIGDLHAADWQFYTGENGAHWSRHVRLAAHILTAAHQLSQASVIYDPALHAYLLASSYFPFAANWPGGSTAHQSTWALWRAPHPWGPWTRFWSGPSAHGFYDPAFVPSWITSGGLGLTILAAADFGQHTLYNLHAFPVTLRW